MNKQSIIIILVLLCIAAVRVVDKFNVNQFYEAVGIVNIKSGASLTNIIVNGITNVGPSSGFGGSTNGFVGTNVFYAYTNYAQTNFVLTSAITNIIQNVATNSASLAQTNRISYFNNGATSVLNSVLTNTSTNVIFPSVLIQLTQGASGAPAVSFYCETNANSGTFSIWRSWNTANLGSTATILIQADGPPINPGSRYYWTNLSTALSTASSSGWRTAELISSR